MTVAYIADLHVANHRKFGGATVGGANKRAQEILSALQTCVTQAASKNAKKLFVLGDLFDSGTPSPALLSRTAKILHRSPIPVVVLVGNHDQTSLHEYDNACSPLGFSKNVEVVEKPKWCVTQNGDRYEYFLCVPHQPGPAKKWLPAVLDHSDPTVKNYTLLLHLGIETENTPWFLRGVDDSIHINQLHELAKTYKFSSVFAGNWHTYKKWHLTDPDLSVVQVGALTPTGFNNPGLKGYGSVVYHTPCTESIFRSVIGGPRYVLCDGVDALLKLSKQKNMQSERNLRVKVSVPPNQLKSVDTTVRMLLSKNSVFEHIEIVPDISDVVKQTRAAAQMTTNAKNLDEAVSTYVGNMPLPDGVDRNSVVTTTRNYLKLK